MDNGDKAFEAEYVQRVDPEEELAAAVAALRPFERLEAIARFHGHGIGSTAEWRISYDDLRIAAMVATAYDARPRPYDAKRRDEATNDANKSR